MSETVTMILTEFLLARITEDESRLPCANCGRPVEPDGPREDGEFGHVAAAEREGSPTAEEFWANPCPSPEPSRKMLAECEAKRRIVEATRFDDAPRSAVDEWLEHPGLTPPREVSVMIDTLRALALPYADHPDYREEWKP
jgi:hypothetical protein